MFQNVPFFLDSTEIEARIAHHLSKDILDTTDGHEQQHHLTGKSGIPLVAIILATTGSVFVLMLVGVFVIHRRRQKYDVVDKESGKLSTKKLEMNAFANAVDSDETDSDNDYDKPVKYLGATAYNVNDEKIVTLQ
jgi:hypothetical protein